jgi:hypothetical protein
MHSSPRPVGERPPLGAARHPHQVPLLRRDAHQVHQRHARLGVGFVGAAQALGYPLQADQVIEGRVALPDDRVEPGGRDELVGGIEGGAEDQGAAALEEEYGLQPATKRPGIFSWQETDTILLSLQ